MQVKEKKLLYIEDDHMFQLNEELHNGCKLNLFVGFGAPKFVDYQKDLIQDFVAEMVEKIGDEESYDIDVIKSHFEVALQGLNVKLKSFADKVRDIDFFPLKGFVQLIMDNVLMTSMIGDVSVMIFRNKKLYYSLNNSLNAKGKIDLFSDFVEGDIQSHDEVVYVGTKIADVLDAHDFNEMEQALATETGHLSHFLKDILHTRIDTSAFGFIFHYALSGGVAKATPVAKERAVDEDSFFYKIKTQFLQNKYQVTVAILSIFIVFMLINLLAQVLRSNKDTIVTSQGVTIDVTIDDIKKDIALFQTLDPTGDEKAMKYHDLLEKLNILETKGKWMDDVSQLKKLLQSEYYKGFNISYISSLNKFDDPTNGKKSAILTFNDSEKSSLGTPQSISMWKNMLIAGSKAALIGAMDDNLRGVLVDYTLPDGESVK